MYILMYICFLVYIHQSATVWFCTSQRAMMFSDIPKPCGWIIFVFIYHWYRCVWCDRHWSIYSNPTQNVINTDPTQVTQPSVWSAYVLLLSI